MKQTALFMPPTLLLMILIVLDSLDFYAFGTKWLGDATDLIHRIVAMLEYDVRILLMSFLISIVADRLSPRPHTKFWCIMPAAANCVILLPCLFTDLFFSYDDAGHFIRGPLHYEPHILSALYILFLFSLAGMAHRRARATEAGILSITGTSVVTKTQATRIVLNLDLKDKIEIKNVLEQVFAKTYDGDLKAMDELIVVYQGEIIWHFVR